MKKIRIALLLIFALEISWFFYKETSDIVVVRQIIQDQELSGVLDSLKVAQISDLHVQKFGIIERKLTKLIREINPEIIFITGDFITSNAGIKPCVKLLKELAANRLIIAVLGNSDHSFKWKTINTKLLAEELKKIPVKLLVNESVKITVGGQSTKTERFLYVIGLDDNFLMLDDIFQAENNLPADGPKILLAHAPNIVEKVNLDQINLILSGHTHGGQIVVPFIGALYTNPVSNAIKKLVSGLYHIENSQLYVNRGLGTSGIGLRLFCQPEITIFEFKT